ncbi:MAG TPA: carboxypeptidase regulatory-like domain-containing protein, partial [Candidatus Thermoplasmatota archaeon]
MIKHLLAFFAAFLPLVTAFGASSPGSTGTVTGRVFNPASGEYIRNAEVVVEGTNLVSTTTSGGHFRLFNVPAGQATLVASYPGAEPVTATVAVPPDGST